MVQRIHVKPGKRIIVIGPYSELTSIAAIKQEGRLTIVEPDNKNSPLVAIPNLKVGVLRSSY